MRPRLEGNEQAWQRLIDVVRKIGVENVVEAMDDDPDGDWVLRLTKRKVDAKGNTISETYSKQNAGDTPTDGMTLKRLSKAPNGGEWKIYEQAPDMRIAYYELVKELCQPAKMLPDLIAQPVHSSGYCLMPMLTDHHFGKIAFSYKGDEWSLNTAREVYENAINYYLQQAQGYHITQILYPIGNDLLHTNSDYNTTKKGTAMEVSSNFANLYRFVRDVIVSSIHRLAEVAPVEVVMVPGNHDEDAVLRLGDYLEGLFDSHPIVRVNNNKYRRKYFRWGSTAIGFAHGEKVKPRDLHGAMSNDVPEIFSSTVHRYYFIGHLHKNATKRMQVYDERRDEYMGTQVEICPSLAPTDKWHFDNNFAGNQRSSKALLFCAAKGRIAEWYYNI